MNELAGLVVGLVEGHVDLELRQDMFADIDRQRAFGVADET